jgi:hypothetical protein
MIVPNDPYLPLSIDQQLLDAIVNITSQRELETLASSFVESITRLTNASTASVYALCGELGQASAKILNALFIQYVKKITSQVCSSVNMYIRILFNTIT